MPQPLSVGLIGYGLAGASFHAPFIANNPDLRLAAVVTRDSERRRLASDHHPHARLFESADQLWHESSPLDLIVVATPNRAHVPLSRAAIAFGAGVVVDKPLAATSADARALIDAARRAGRMLTVFQNRRWDGDFRTLRQLINQQRLGLPLRFESRFERWRPQPAAGWRHLAAPEDAGGLLYDLGSHLIDQAMLLFGPVAHVYAELDRRHAETAVDDDSFVALTHESGVRSHLFMSVMAAQLGPRFRLLGSTAAYVKFGLDVQESALRSGQQPVGPQWGLEPSDRWGRIGHGDAWQDVPTLPGDYRQFYAGVVAALRGDAPPPVDPADAVRTLAVIEAAQRSAAGGTVVAISEKTATE